METVNPLYSTPAENLRGVREVVVRKYFVHNERFDLPLIAKRNKSRAFDRVKNVAMFQSRFSQGLRPVIHFNPEVLLKIGRKTCYRRLHASQVYLSCPNPEQAELALELVMRFIESLSGKWLAPDAANSY